METRDYRGVEIELTEAERKKLLDQLKEYKALTDEKIKDTVENAREATSFLLGNHFENHRTNKDDDRTPEEMGGRDRVYPNVPFLVHRIAKIVQFVRNSDANPTVEPEDNTKFELPPDHPFMQMLQNPDIAQAFVADSHNEFGAKILAARLKLMLDRSDLDTDMSKVLAISASEKVVCVLVGYDHEQRGEKAFMDRVRIGDFGYDPEAPTVLKGRWAWYVERGRRRQDVLREYGIKEADGNDVIGKDVTTQYAAQGPQRSFDDEGYGSQAGNGDKAPDENKTIDVWHWWIRNTETIQGTPDETLVDEAGETVEAEASEVPKFNGGWQYVVVAGGRVLFHGDSRSPTGNPPLHTFTFEPVGDKITGLSAYDLVKDINKAMDRLQQYAIEAAYKMQPKTLIDRDKVKNYDKLAENTVAGFVDLDLKAGTLADAVAYMPGGGGSNNLMEQFDRLKALGDEILGTAQLDIKDAARTQMSGDMHESIMADREGGLSYLRDRFHGFQREVYRDMLQHIIAYEDEDVTVRITNPADGSKQYIKIPMYALRLDDTDFELAWDIRIESLRNAPKSPPKRLDYMLKITQTLMQIATQNQGVAAAFLEMIDVPDKAKLSEMIQMMAPPPADPNAPAAPDPMAQAQAENDMAVKRRAAESTADAYETIIKEIAKVDIERAIQMADALHIQVDLAYNTGQPQTPGAPMDPGMPPAGPEMPQDAPIDPALADAQAELGMPQGPLPGQ